MKVEEYYDQSTKYLIKYWSDTKSLSIHYGFWYDDTTSRQEAFLNQHRAVAELLDPKKGELILDAGCGVGGVSIWLAKQTKAKFVGITLSAKQVSLANQFAANNNVSDRISFHKMNFFNTDFQNNKFDKAFFIESLCHAYPKQHQVFNEIFRILKNGATLLISDSILLRQPKNKKEEKWVSKFCQGWAMDTISTLNEIVDSLKKSKFINIDIIDRTEVIKKNIDKIYKIGLLSYPILKLQQLFGSVSKVVLGNNMAAFAQKKLVDAGLAGYVTITAQKK